MPKLNLKQLNPSTIGRIINDKSLAQQYVYNTVRWKKMRLRKLKENPICEECLKYQIVTSATQVHHIQPFMSGQSVQMIQALGFDYSNLQSLCYQCHKNMHNKNK